MVCGVAERALYRSLGLGAAGGGEVPLQEAGHIVPYLGNIAVLQHGGRARFCCSLAQSVWRLVRGESGLRSIRWGPSQWCQELWRPCRPP